MKSIAGAKEQNGVDYITIAIALLFVISAILEGLRGS